MFTFAIANIIDRKYKILVTQDGLDRLDWLDRLDRLRLEGYIGL